MNELWSNPIQGGYGNTTFNETETEKPINFAIV